MVHDKYLSVEEVQSWFTPNVVRHINKVRCGNGGTTSFLKIAPKHGWLNILIMPNKAAAISKQKDYTDNPQKYNGNRLTFRYEGNYDVVSHENTDVLIVVSDSFRHSDFKRLAIDKVLIDEYHTVLSGESFRKSLYNFVDYVSNVIFKYNTSASITTVTATPLETGELVESVASEVYSSYELKTIYVSNDVKKNIDKVSAYINEGLPVIVFSNSANLIARLSQSVGGKYKKLRANFIVGAKLMEGLSVRFKIEHDAGALLTIVSSVGFEGFDYTHNIPHSFVFDDRAFEHATLSMQNVIQAFNRARLGSLSYNYVRSNIKKVRDDVPKMDVINKYIHLNTISDFEKQNASNLGNKKKYLLFKNNNDDVSVDISILKGVLFGDYERNMFDSIDNVNVISYFKSHGFLMEDLGDESSRLKAYPKTPSKYIPLNVEIIKVRGLFEHIRFAPFIDNSGNTPFSTIIKQLFKDTNLFIEISTALNSLDIDRQYMDLTNAHRFVKFISDFKVYFKSITEHELLYRLKKHGDKRSKGYKASKEKWDKQGPNMVLEVAIGMVNNVVRYAERPTGFRDFNAITSVSMDSISLIGALFGLRVQEMDIKGAFLGIVYAHVLGNRPPSSIYGEKKKNKIKILSYLNQFHKSKAKYNNIPELIRSLRKRGNNFGINKEVLNYMIDTFTNSDYKGDFYNFATSHEQNIIKKATKHIKKLDESGSYLDAFDGFKGMVRRHDGILMFGNIESFNFDFNLLNDVYYLGTNEWFSSKSEPNNLQPINVNDIYKPLMQEISTNIPYVNKTLKSAQWVSVRYHAPKMYKNAKVYKNGARFLGEYQCDMEKRGLIYIYKRKQLKKIIKILKPILKKLRESEAIIQPKKKEVIHEDIRHYTTAGVGSKISEYIGPLDGDVLAPNYEYQNKSLGT